MKYLLILSFLVPVISHGQNYNDVAVLMNTNDPESILIGEYFQEKNSIPDENMIYLDMPMDELIDSIQFAEIADDMNVFFGTHPNEEVINYIVSTKGCPQAMTVAQASVSSKPFEILISNLETIETFPTVVELDGPFLFSETNYRIVSRLEAGTLDGAFALIDRGGLQNIDLGLDIVLDLYAPFTTVNGDSAIVALLQSKLTDNANILNDLGFSTVLDTQPSYYNSDEEISIFAQIAWGGNGVPLSPFVEKTKSFGIVEQGFSALKSSYGQGLSVFDFLEGKCHAALGYVDYFYFSSFNRTNFFQNYLDVSKNRTIGECVFISTGSFTPIILFGDPKSKVQLISSTPNIENPIATSIFPVPTKDHINIHFEDAKDRMVKIFDQHGRLLQRNLLKATENQINISELSDGFLVIAIIEGDRVDVRKIIKI